jgi:hypothetical protein
MTKPLAAVLVCAAMALPVAPAGAATAAAAAPLKVMPLGDSITNGLGSIPYAATVAWLDAHPGSRTDPDWEEAHTDPNGAGYAKMAWKWYQAMNGVLGAGRWPAGNDPYTRTRVSRCISWTAAPFARYAVGCHTWYLNRAKRLWQLPVVTTRTVKVGGTTRKVSSTRWITGW